MRLSATQLLTASTTLTAGLTQARPVTANTGLQLTPSLDTRTQASHALSGLGSLLSSAPVNVAPRQPSSLEKLTQNLGIAKRDVSLSLLSSQDSNGDIQIGGNSNTRISSDSGEDPSLNTPLTTDQKIQVLQKEIGIINKKVDIYVKNSAKQDASHQELFSNAFSQIESNKQKVQELKQSNKTFSVSGVLQTFSLLAVTTTAAGAALVTHRQNKQIRSLQSQIDHLTRHDPADSANTFELTAFHQTNHQPDTHNHDNSPPPYPSNEIQNNAYRSAHNSASPNVIGSVSGVVQDHQDGDISLAVAS